MDDKYLADLAEPLLMQGEALRRSPIFDGPTGRVIGAAVAVTAALIPAAVIVGLYLVAGPVALALGGAAVLVAALVAA